MMASDVRLEYAERDDTRDAVDVELFPWSKIPILQM